MEICRVDRPYIFLSDTGYTKICGCGSRFDCRNELRGKPRELNMGTCSKCLEKLKAKRATDILKVSERI